MQSIHTEQVDVGESFIVNGLSSVSSVALIADLAHVLDTALPETLPWEYPSISALAEHLATADRSPRDD